MARHRKCMWSFGSTTCCRTVVQATQRHDKAWLARTGSGTKPVLQCGGLAWRSGGWLGWMMGHGCISYVRLKKRGRWGYRYTYCIDYLG